MVGFFLFFLFVIMYAVPSPAVIRVAAMNASMVGGVVTEDS